MYQAIDQWKESGISPRQFCINNKLTLAAFNFWLKKYLKDKDIPKNSPSIPVNTFIPVEITNIKESSSLNDGQIEISYSNGVRLSFSGNIAIDQLKNLISI